MAIDPAIFRALVAQGATPEMLLAVVEADAAVDEARRASKREGNAERQRRFKAARKAGNEGNALLGVTEREHVSSPPNEYISNPPVNPCEANASQSPFAEIVVSAWNDGPAKRGARKAQKLDTARKRDLTARVKEHGQDGVLAAIRGIAASDWHCGIGSNGWKANLGWLLERSKRVTEAMERADEATGDTNAKPIVADQTAYLAGLADKPWANATPRAEQPRRTGNTGPIRAIGDCLPLAGVG